MKSKSILILLATVLAVTLSAVGKARQQGPTAPVKNDPPQTGVKSIPHADEQTKSKPAPSVPADAGAPAATQTRIDVVELDKARAQAALMRAAAARTLERAPNLVPRPLDAFSSEAEFIDAVRRFTGGAKMSSADDAVQALERLLAGAPDVTAVVTSSPTTGLAVRYRPVDSSAPYLDTKTDNTSLSVKAKTYFFIATDDNGKEEKQRVACARGCDVTFYPPFK